MSSASGRVPVTVLTGFLGSGKTTLLNRILSERHGKRIAVIENEFGEVGVDHQLVIGAQEEIFETSNGCICCTVRGDLIRVLGTLMKRRDKFDYIMVETTGLAEPGPVAQTFFLDDDLKEQFVLDAIVTLIDAKHFEKHLDEVEQTAEQVAFADVMLLNKTDLVPESDLARIERRIRAINATAKIYTTQNANVPIDKVLDVGAFDLDRALAKDSTFLEPQYAFEWAGMYALTPGQYRVRTGEHTHAHADVHEHAPASLGMGAQAREHSKVSALGEKADEKAQPHAVVGAQVHKQAAAREHTQGQESAPLAAGLSARAAHAQAYARVDAEGHEYAQSHAGVGTKAGEHTQATGHSQDDTHSHDHSHPHSHARLGLLVLPASHADAAGLLGQVDTAVKAFDGVPVEVACGGVLEPGVQLYRVDVGHEGSEVTLNVVRAGAYAVFCEHEPREFALRIEGVEPAFEKTFASHHHHDEEISSIGIADPRPLDARKLNDWLSYLLQSRGQDIFRMKGVLNVRGEDRRYVFHGVHMMFDGKLERPWNTAPRSNSLVFIGRNLDRQELEAGFASCIA